METLNGYETAITCIETVDKNGLMFITSGQDLSIAKRSPEIPGYDKEAAKLVVSMVKQHKEAIKALTSDPESIRKTLQNGQIALSEAFNHANTLLDLFDRLEKAYRLVFPDVKACIHDKPGCPKDSIVLCTACSGVSNAT